MAASIQSARLTEKNTSAPDESTGRNRRCILFFWILALLLGTIQLCAGLHSMSGDGISYLDMADLWVHGDRGALINPYWSPLYPLLLSLALLAFRPSPYWEFAVANLTNLVIYLVALASFHFFLKQVLRRHRSVGTGCAAGGHSKLPEPIILSLGYTVFLWSSLVMIGICSATPDMCVAALVYLACGLLLRISLSPKSWAGFALLGAALGLGYLAKTIMFPLALVFLIACLLSAGPLRQAAPRTLLALGVFLSLASLFIIPLSTAKHRLTFGETGRLNYSWFVNRTPVYYHWQGQPAGTGTPQHTTRRIFDLPPVYEFASPVGGTYPPWFDPSYWHEGLRLHFDWKQQLATLLGNGRVYYDLFFRSQSDLFVGCLMLYCLVPRPASSLRRQSILLAPAAAALAVYAAVYVEWRHVAPFVALFWIGVFSGIEVANNGASMRFARAGAAVMIVVLGIRLLLSTAEAINKDGGILASWRDPSRHLQWQVADGLRRLGVPGGARVGRIGYLQTPLWARVARVQVIAEIPPVGAPSFWSAAPAAKSQVMQAFSRTGAKAVLAEHASRYALPDGWQRVGTTGYWVYFLSQ